ncbi:MAG: hypothetical protein M3O03_10540 [Pseudomonadota bacterium]|nr:hypothetical protein [Pseudomonadota bacterium]
MTPTNAPRTREELNSLPEYPAKDAERVYEGEQKLAVTWIDAKGNIWWLGKRPDGSYCKAPADQ